MCPKLPFHSKDDKRPDLTKKLKTTHIIASGGLHKDLKKSFSTINDDEPNKLRQNG